MRRIKGLRPDNFTLTQNDEELAIMTLIQALPEEYSHFTSALLLLKDLDKSTVEQAFNNEENQHHVN